VAQAQDSTVSAIVCFHEGQMRIGVLTVRGDMLTVNHSPGKRDIACIGFGREESLTQVKDILH